MRVSLGGLLLCLLAAACASTTLEVPARHPASPSAPSAPAADPGRILEADFVPEPPPEEEPEEEGGHPHHQHGPSQPPATQPSPGQPPPSPAPPQRPGHGGHEHGGDQDSHPDGGGH